MITSRSFPFVLVMLVLGVNAAAAQSSLADGPDHKTTLSVTGGLVRGMHPDLPIVGATFVYDLDDWFSLEARGGSFNHHSGPKERALFLGGSLLVDLVPPRNRITPYLAAGAGLYRTFFIGQYVEVGSGINFDVSDRVAVRPDLRTIIMFGEGDRHAHAVYSVNVGYQF